jgi:hypothetical protein
MAGAKDDAFQNRVHRERPIVQSTLLSSITISCLTVPPVSAQSKFDTMHIGAFDPDAWNGIVFETQPD